MGDVREPAVSGTFYPNNPRVLRKDVEEYLDKVPQDDIHGSIMGLISPHAGYMYSGQTAAYGYKMLSGRSYDTVIVIAPSHRASFAGAAVFPSIKKFPVRVPDASVIFPMEKGRIPH